MIETPTCLILGAGASVPYFFPSGIELRRIILSNLKDPKPENTWCRQLYELGIEDGDLIKSFYYDFKISRIRSIDKFLELRPEYLPIGKLAIALGIIPLEIHNSIFPDLELTEQWYTILFNKLLTSKFERLRHNRLFIITFNYDRSLEHFLFNAVKSAYPIISDEQGAFFINTLNIIHVHGQLGNLPWQGGGLSRPFGPKATPDQYKISAKQIIIVSEQDPRSQVYRNCYSCLCASQRIFFLGFGFDEANYQRLDLGSLPLLNEKQIWATSLGLGKAEIESLKQKSPFLNFGSNNLDISGFFKEVICLE